MISLSFKNQHNPFSPAHEDVDLETKELAFVGSKTETALLQFAKDLGWGDWKETCDSAKVIQMIPFSSDREAMGVVVHLSSGTYRLFLKGASEISVPAMSLFPRSQT